MTDKGRDLARVILVIKRWGDTYSAAEASRRPLVHITCGATFHAAIVCQECGQEIGDDAIRDVDPRNPADRSHRTRGRYL